MENESRVTIGLCNPKDASNVGSILRAAGCFGAKEILFTGTRYLRAAQYNTDTRNASKHIPTTQTQDLLASKPQGSQLVCVELVENAAPLPQFQHPLNAFYIFGPEDGTIPQAIIDQADFVVYVPTIGCLNLAATVNVVLYDRIAKSDGHPSGNELILSSRDINNRTKVRSKK